MKDTVGPTMAIGGGSMTFTPSLIIQIVGAVVGVAGIILTFYKIRENQIDREETRLNRLEQTRQNDIAEKRLHFEMENASNARSRDGKITTAQKEK